MLYPLVFKHENPHSRVRTRGDHRKKKQGVVSEIYSCYEFFSHVPVIYLENWKSGLFLESKKQFTVHNCYYKWGPQFTTVLQQTPSLPPLFIPYSLFTVAILPWEKAMARLMITSNWPTNCLLISSLSLFLIQTWPGVTVERKNVDHFRDLHLMFLPHMNWLSFCVFFHGKVYNEKENQNCKIQKPCQSHCFCLVF